MVEGATTREECLARMNAAWQLFAYLDMENPFAPPEASDAVNARFTEACSDLERLGVRWLDLPYDGETKTFSLPAQ